MIYYYNQDALDGKAGSINDHTGATGLMQDGTTQTGTCIHLTERKY